jgi:hypothetical protein
MFDASSMTGKNDSGGHHFPRFSSWLVSFLLAEVLWIVEFYVVFHIGFDVPLSTLVGPFSVISAVTLSMAPALYWARKKDVLLGQGTRRFAIAVTCGTLAIVLTLFDVGVKIGLLPQPDTLGYFALGIGGAFAFVVVYRALRRDPRRSAREGP